MHVANAATTKGKSDSDWGARAREAGDQEHDNRRVVYRAAQTGGRQIERVGRDAGRHKLLEHERSDGHRHRRTQAVEDRADSARTTDAHRLAHTEKRDNRRDRQSAHGAHGARRSNQQQSTDAAAHTAIAATTCSPTR